MNITEDYVSFKVAELLKEKGFDWESFASIKVFRGNRYEVNGEMIVPKEDTIIPTLQTAIKWLRRVHKLHITISLYLEEEPILNEPIPNFKYSHYICKENEFWDVAAPVTGFDTYEQAAENAIKYCLENLI